MTGKRTLFLGSAVALILAALVVADREAAAMAERGLAERLRCATGAAEAPDVEIDGFPMLTQLATGHLDRVDVRAESVRFGTATITHIRARATDVRLSNGTVTARSLSVYATVSYPDLAGYLRAGGTGAAPDLRIIGGTDQEQLILQADIVVDDRRLPAAVYADVSILDDWLIIEPEEAELSVAGVGPSTRRLDVVSEPVRSVGLPELPSGLDYQAAGGSAEGLQVLAAGAQLRVFNATTCRD